MALSVLDFEKVDDSEVLDIVRRRFLEPNLKSTFKTFLCNELNFCKMLYQDYDKYVDLWIYSRNKNIINKGQINDLRTDTTLELIPSTYILEKKEEQYKTLLKEKLNMTEYGDNVEVSIKPLLDMIEAELLLNGVKTKVMEQLHKITIDARAHDGRTAFGLIPNVPGYKTQSPFSVFVFALYFGKENKEITKLMPKNSWITFQNKQKKKKWKKKRNGKKESKRN